MKGRKGIIFPISRVSLYNSLPYEKCSHHPRVDTYTTYISNGPISWLLSFADMSLQRRECLDGSGGMFLWVRLRVGYHPQLYILSPEEISDKVVQTLIGEKIMVAPSSYSNSKRLEGLYGLKAKNVEEA